MKSLKIISFLFVLLAFINCGDDNATPPFLLSKTNLEGSYNIGSLTGQEKEDAKSSSGAIVNLSTTNIVGDIFQLNLNLNSIGNYTATGSYSVVSTTTDANGDSSEEKQIFNADASGNFQLNTTANTITFNQTSGDFIEGVYTITTFNETTVTLTQEDVEEDGSLIYTRNITITFVRN